MTRAERLAEALYDLWSAGFAQDRSDRQDAEEAVYAVLAEAEAEIAALKEALRPFVVGYQVTKPKRERWSLCYWYEPVPGAPFGEFSAVTALEPVHFEAALAALGESE